MIQVQVAKMNCGGCARSVTRAIHRLDPGARVEIHLASGAFAITTGTAIEADRFADAIASQATPSRFGPARPEFVGSWKPKPSFLIPSQGPGDFPAPD